MDDRLKETLSAMMDDQADELAIRRLLSRAELPEVRQQWQRWQSMQSLMHDDRRAFATLDVSAAVQDALSEKTATSVAVATPQARQVQSRSARWSAVAAVSFALLVGFGAGSQWGFSSPEASAELALSAEPYASNGSGADSLGLGKVATNKAGVPEIALQGLDARQRERMSRYLLEHAQHNSVGMGYGSMGYARVASASTVGY
ncbi:sigma-E factor negative regulatory protein [Marinobacter sp. BGYM27]|uniref:sigma-E factor negative regulatory protein n=1 Tax=Marinobacter sp. BGYM27 TaxID=2975597 RepID=UPI0021A408C5|nr:sigma-E factor negative regulatory protein [Marinobacter sp. BGYM27]MDG5498272.1 sigma-E factor negative regulatory protein [Marinobacter sp. BGYM27]